jgi:uncharacterized protein (UPF0212 family)
MRSGQAHTTWFPELKILLKERWTLDLTIEEQFSLLADLNTKLNQIRIDNNIQPPMMWCPNCKERRRSRFTEISITGLYFALERFELSSENEIKRLRKSWKKYSLEKNLNIYGKSIDKNIPENEIHK